jgi:hypothetical protein
LTIQASETSVGTYFFGLGMYSKTNRLLICAGRATLLGGLCLLTASAACQESAEKGMNARGSRAEIAVNVRDKSGQVISTPIVIKLSNNGTLGDQRSTIQGRAFFIFHEVWETLPSPWKRWATRQCKRKSITVAMQYQEDVYLERDEASAEAPAGVLLAPKAKEALGKGAGASRAGKLEEAQNLSAKP